MINVANSASEVRISVECDLDDATLPTFESMLTALSLDSRRVTVDLMHCSYINSSVIAALIRAHRRSPDTFEVLIAERGVVNKIFDVCGFIDRNFLVRVANESDRRESI